MPVLAGGFIARFLPVALAAALWPVAGAAISPDRLADWSRAGTEDGIPKIKVSTDFSAYAPAGNGEVDDYPKLEKAIAECQSPGAVYIPAGTYLLKSAIRMRNGVVLRGAGAGKTNLVFDLPSRAPEAAILFEGTMEGARELVQAAAAGTMRIVLKSSEGLMPGEDIVISTGKDDAVPAKGARRAPGSAGLGQVVRIKAIVKRALFLDVPLRLDYPLSDSPKVRRLKAVAWAGLEDLEATRQDSREGAVARFSSARDCWISNCSFANAARAHVELEASRFITVRGSFFHHASSRADGGHGCGVVAGRWASDNIITNNVFWNLRHAMVARSGASGNVFSFNFSCESVDERGRPSPDMVASGPGTCENLFEGNSVKVARLGEPGIPVGPRNTAFRNRICGCLAGREKNAVVVEGGPCSVNVVGNTLASGRVNAAKAAGALVEANRSRTVLEKADPLQASCYLAAAPDFWGTRPWPGLGADLDKGLGLARGWTPLPAQERFEELTGIPPCPCAATRAVRTDETAIIE